VVSRAERSLSFGAVAGDYDRLRPGPSPDAVDWLLPGRAEVVVGLGAPSSAISRRTRSGSLAAMSIPDLVEWLTTDSRVITASDEVKAAGRARATSALAEQFPDATEIEVPMRSHCWRADRVPRS
jgi:hypothetical protein